ncbi:nucleotidyltransferase domain-containing protein, partial [bacterium]|nr:nucleotidyltransferase domain-containing protein [bacterium]
MTLDITRYEFFKKLTELPFVDEIWLYGSRARGTNGERADIDLAILGNSIDRKQWFLVEEIIEEADT